MPDIPTKIARLIHSEPTITVRQLATALGYSEVKSIYYWLAKCGFSRIQDFRAAVLRGEFPPCPSGSAQESVARESAPYPFPLATGFSAEGTPCLSGSYAVNVGGIPQQCFAWRLERYEYLPLFHRGDLLLIDPQAAPAAGQLVLGSTDTVRIYRLYHLEERSVLAPLDQTDIVLPLDQVQILGVVRGLLRSM